MRFALVPVLLLALTACGSVIDPDAEGGGGAGGTGGTGGGGDDPVARGQALFAHYCAPCHGADATGAAMYGGSIQGRTGILPVVRSGPGMMPTFPQLSDEDVADIEAWLASLVSNGDLDGREVFALECASCHGVEGAGTHRGPQLHGTPAGFGTFVVRGGRNQMGFGSPMPAFSPTVVTDDQLAEIWSWMASIPNPTDGEGLYLRFCGNCHGANAAGGRVGESLLARSLDDPEDFREETRRGRGDNRYGDRTRYMPARSEAELSDAEIQLIVEYVQSLARR